MVIVETENSAVHVMPMDGTDIRDHEDNRMCWCNPVREMKPEYKGPVYIHNKAKDNPQ